MSFTAKKLKQKSWENLSYMHASSKTLNKRKGTSKYDFDLD